MAARVHTSGVFKIGYGGKELADTYAFVPADGVRPVGVTMAHIALTSRYLAANATTEFLAESYTDHTRAMRERMAARG